MLYDATESWYSQINKQFQKGFFKKEYEWLANDLQISEVFTTNVRERKKLTMKGTKPKAMQKEQSQKWCMKKALNKKTLES